MPKAVTVGCSTKRLNRDYLGVVGNQKFLVKQISFFFKVDFCMVFAKSVFYKL